MANAPCTRQTSHFAFAPWNHARGKRIFDLIFSSMFLLLLFPLLLLVGLIVRLTSPGPALFRQYRVGRDGRPFQLLKFRTMYQGSDAGPALTMQSDTRVTPAGRLLRKLKLDELPQLLNVLRGEMTVVGPRPDLEEYLAELPPDLRPLTRLRPGITGVASLCYRDEETLFAGQSQSAQRQFYVSQLLPAKARLDLDYASRASCAGDLKLIARTVLALFSASGSGHTGGQRSDLRLGIKP